MKRLLLLCLGLALLCVTACNDDDDAPADDDVTSDDDATSDDDDDDSTPSYADADGDGVPDLRDLCPDTRAGVDHDPRGCSSMQASGCSIAIEAPADGEAISGGSVTFDFDGDCEGYRLYASDSEAFPPHRRTLLGDLLPAGEVEVDGDDLPEASGDGFVYWAVEGSARGHSFLSEIRTLQVSP
jgi:hypothetical protein